MLKKLLKYDLRYMLKNMSIFYVLSIIAALLTRLFFSLNQTTFIYVIGQICVGVMFSMIFSALVNTIIRSWVRFKASLYGDEAYLYHTLPVTRKELLLAKILESIIFTLISFVSIIISLLIAYASKENFEALKVSLSEIANTLNINITVVLIFITIILFEEIINAIQAGFIGIILGNRMHDKKGLYTFIYGFIFYLITQAITVLLVLLIGLFDSNIMKIFTDNVMLDSSSLLLLGISIIVIYGLIIFTTYLKALKLFKNKLNVE